MFWLLSLLACDMAEGLCLDAGLGVETCSDPAVPVEGPWTVLLATDTPLDACDVRPVDLDDGWTLAPAGPAFTLAAPVRSGDAAPVGAAACALEGDAFTCAPTTGPAGVTVTASGVLDSRSEASVVLELASATCDTRVEAPFVATWTLEAPEPACPDIEDDSFSVDRSVPEVGVAVTNASDQSLRLFLLEGEGPVFLAEAPAGGVTSSSARPGNWMMLATGFEQEACVFAFEVTAEGQQETYWGG